MTGAQAATVAGIAAVALGLGYGVASMGGSDSPPAAKPAAAATLPAVTPTAKVRIAVLGAAPSLPAPKRTRTARPVKTAAPHATPAPTAAPTAAPTSAPTSAPTAAPTPARTPDTGTIG